MVRSQLGDSPPRCLNEMHVAETRRLLSSGALAIIMSIPATLLLLDPGTRRKGSLVSKCALGTCLFVIASVVVLFVGLIDSTLWGLLSKGVWPHSNGYHNSTHSDLFVIPVWSMDERFDIGVSVWLRPTDEEPKERAERRAAGLGRESARVRGSGNL